MQRQKNTTVAALLPMVIYLQVTLTRRSTRSYEQVNPEVCEYTLMLVCNHAVIQVINFFNTVL